MANRFFTFTNQFISGSVAKSSEVNSQFQQVEAGFDANALEMNCAIKVPAAESATNFLMTQNAAARANNLLQFNASGFPVASSALLTDLSAGSHKITNLATAVAAGDAVSLGQMQAYAASLAGVPSISGAANPSCLITDGATISWGAGTTYLLPTLPAANGSGQNDDGRFLVWSGGITRWLYANENCIIDPDGAMGSKTWSTQLESVETIEGRFWRVPAAGFAAVTFDHEPTSSFRIPAISAAWGFSVICTTTSVTAGTIALVLKYYDSGGVLLGESATTNVPITATSIRLRVSANSTHASAAYVTPVIRFTGVTVAAGQVGLTFRQLKVERGQQSTPGNSHAATVDWLAKSKIATEFGWGQTTPYIKVGDGSSTASALVLKGATGTQDDAVVSVIGGTNGTAYAGAMSLYAKSVKAYCPIGYASEYDAGNAGAGLTIDFMGYQRGPKQKVTLNAATPTITISTTGLIVGQYQLKVVQDAGVARVVTWAGFNASDCIGGTVPVITTTLSGVTFVYFYWDGSKFWVSSNDWS